MSDTPSKKNSIFDKALLGTAGILAIGMMALGPRGEDNPSPDNEKLAENQGVGKEEGQKAPAGMKEGKSGDPNVQAFKKVKAALEAEEGELLKILEQKEQLIKNLEKLLKEAKSGN